MKLDDDTYENLRKKYVEKLDNSFNEEKIETNTRQYDEFRKENLPKPYSWYEYACVKAEKILPLKPNPKKVSELKEAIEMCHLQVTPGQTFSLAAVTSLLMVFLSLIALFMVPYLLNKEPDMFIMMFALLGSIVVFFGLNKVPNYLANTWRMKSSNQMVLCIFYIVTYMRHTSNLELAIDFSAEHLDPPLSLDMKKIVWDMETGKFSSLKQSLDAYMLRWEKLNPQFVESMQNIESSLLEASEDRRLGTLDKALNIMLDDTFEHMIHYTHDLKSPITTLHMLGIILPILGLVILPLLVSFMPSVRWIHIAVIYNIALPLSVYFLGKNILSNRPGGYGHGETIPKDLRVSVGKFKVTPIFMALLVFTVCFFIAIIPLLIHFVSPNFDVISKGDSAGFHSVDVSYEDELQGVKYWFLEYRLIEYEKSDGTTVSDNRGPFGIISSLLSLFLVIAFGVGFGVYYKFRSKAAMKTRKSAEKIELEFASALFQLGNRLADGLPLEIAFSKVSGAMSHSMTGKFFDMVSSNIARLGMSIEEAIFDEEYGAIRYFPSSIIESSMKVLVESAKKGPLVASNAIINVSNYIKQMHRVDERLKDLLADVVSSMTSQIKFLTPVIAGIVVGITSMITGILGTLTRQFSSLQGDLGAAGAQAGGMGDMLSSMKGGIPTFYFQIVVGLYVVQIVYILTSLVVGIENGTDKLGEQYSLGQNLIKSTLLYVILTAVVMFLFNFIAGSIVTPGA